MTEKANKKPYDLEARTFVFARQVRDFLKSLPRTLANREDARQVIRSSGSVGANCIEANESLSRKDFRVRIKICRKEAKESAYWLRLLNVGQSKEMNAERDALVDESMELMKIFNAIAAKSS